MLFRSTKKAPPRVVCRNVAPAEPDCAAAQVRADWCTARLRAAERPRPTSAPPEAKGLDDPEDWAARAPALLRACGIDATIAATECSEYPCVSAFTPGSVDPHTLDQCQAADLGGQEWIASLPVTVDCDGTPRTMWMLAVVEKTTFEELYPRAAGKFLPDELTLLGARRAEAVAHAWGCP